MRSLPFILLALAALTASPARGEFVRLTVYDDGLSCPSECDAHVVFSGSLNGTEFAHDPSTTAKPFSKCIKGGTCRLCIESGGKQCLQAIYRGGGPAPMTFDFTPAFYTAACIGTPSQERLAAKCAELRSAARALEGRMNCIAEPSSDACKELIVAAQKAKSDDMPKYNKCIAVGQQTYNQGRAMAERRSNNCAYELHGTGGPNSKGTSWRKLLPGACRKGTFVGRDGLDCCSGVLLADGPLGLECRLFYPPKASN